MCHERTTTARKRATGRSSSHRSDFMPIPCVHSSLMDLDWLNQSISMVWPNPNHALVSASRQPSAEPRAASCQERFDLTVVLDAFDVTRARCRMRMRADHKAT